MKKIIAALAFTFLLLGHFQGSTHDVSVTAADRDPGPLGIVVQRDTV